MENYSFAYHVVIITFLLASIFGCLYHAVIYRTINKKGTLYKGTLISNKRPIYQSFWHFNLLFRCYPVVKVDEIAVEQINIIGFFVSQPYQVNDSVEILFYAERSEKAIFADARFYRSYMIYIAICSSLLAFVLCYVIFMTANK